MNMRYFYLFVIVMAAGLTINGCETPSSPDFKVNQKIQFPILSGQTYQFLGGKDALIDSTDPDFSDFFSTQEGGANDGLITLSKQESFDFGDLDGAIPDVDVTPTTVNSEVGELALTDFNSGDGALGSATFQEVTGQDPNLVPIGTPLVAGSQTVEIAITTDFLQSATIKGNNGTIAVTITNDLGFEIDALTLTFRAGTTDLASDQMPATETFPDDDVKTFTLSFSDGQVLEDLKVVVDVSWDSDPTTDNPNELIVSALDATDLYASQVQASLSSQDFNSSGSVDVDDSAFEFTAADHYIEIASGRLIIDQIVNEIDLYIDPMVISFPGIRTAPYGVGDSLTVTFQGNSRIPRPGGTADPTQDLDLTDMRIYAEGNQVSYNITGTTENTQDGAGSIRTISETDKMSATVEIRDLSIKSAVGVVVPRNVIVNDDDPNNGTDVINIFNDIEAELIEIDALKDLSDQLDGIEFDNPKLNLTFDSNIGVETTIYGGFVGSDASGNQLFLKGLDEPGNPYRVADSELPQELTANGVGLTADQLVKFTIDAAPIGGTTSGSVEFNRTTTNVDDFLNNLPSEIRFVSLAKVNSSGAVGSITDPVQFTPAFNIDIPLNFSATSATYSDTLETDLSELPGPGDDQQLTEATLALEYTNGLPIGLGLTLVFQDEVGGTITDVASDLSLEGANVDSQTGFVAQPATGLLKFELNRAQLERINQTRNIKVDITLNTSEQSAVKIRETDSISFRLSLSGSAESTVN